MNNFKHSGPGGLRNRPEFVGGRPSSDADYSTKKKFGKKPGFGGKRGGDRGDRGDRGGRGGHGDRGGRGGFGGGRGGERREVEMFKITCSACGKAAEVPFRPDGSKPVLCRDCFASNKPTDRGGDRGGRGRYSYDRKPERSFAAPQGDRGISPDYKALLAQVSALETKMDEILALLKTAPAPVATPDEAEMTEVIETPAKEKKPKKVVAKKVAKKAVKKVTEKKVAKKAAKKVVKKATRSNNK